MIPLLRSALFNVGAAVLTFGIGFLLLPTLVTRRSAGFTVQLWARLVLWWLALSVGLRVRLTGAEHLPEGPAILAAKHQSTFDTVFWLTLDPLPAYVLKRELLLIPFYGWYCGRAGMLPVDRAGGGPALKRMMRGAQRVVAEGRKIVIFPEGTRTAPGERRAWHPGVAALLSTGAPLVPVATDSGAFWGRRAFRKRPGVLTVAVLPAVPAGLPRGLRIGAAEAAVEAESLRLIGREPTAGPAPRAGRAAPPA
jgi:1-acyl-sn-glycerol-3-phosphate acyltransferase